MAEKGLLYIMERKKDKIKILISYHKESEIIKSEIMTPIQVGAKSSNIDLKVLRDDEGRNISDKNDKYCELTAQYWAWKNLDADYYGFMHYRRHFVFEESAHRLDPRAFLWYDRIDDSYKKDIGLNDVKIRRCVENVDIILPIVEDTSSWGAVSNEVQFSTLDNLHAVDFDIVCKTAIELYPDYYEAVQEFRTNHYAYWYNMFIMRKELFLNYSEWLFRILEASEKKINFTSYNQQETRTLAFMAERLFSIYLIKLFKSRPELKVKFLKMTFVYHTDKNSYENVENLEKKNEMTNYVCSVEKAYKELKKISLPYDFVSLFQVKGDRFEKLLLEKKMIFYGAGNWCRQLMLYFDRLGIKYPVEIWDKEAKSDQMINGVRVVKPDFDSFSKMSDAFCLITIRDQLISNEVKQLLINQGKKEVIENREFVNWLSYKLWLDTDC